MHDGNCMVIYGIHVQNNLGINAAERNIGFYTSFQMAEEALLGNSVVIAETSNNVPHYRYACIEKCVDGLYQLDNTFDDDYIQWYEFDAKSLKYRKIDTPDEMEGIVGLIFG